MKSYLNELVSEDYIDILKNVIDSIDKFDIDLFMLAINKLDNIKILEPSEVTILYALKNKIKNNKYQY